MNHQQIYESIINKAKSKTRKKGDGIYYENHHINPKSLGGDNSSNNLVLLTAKEHFICHKLLTYIYPNSLEMSTAFHFMVYGARNKNINVSANDYKYARELTLGDKNPFYGKTHSKAIKDKLSLLASSRTGKHNHNYGNSMSVESRNKISKAHKGKKISAEQKSLVSEKLKGRVLSGEHKNKIKQSKIGIPRPTKTCKYCGVIMAVGNFERYHDEKCKHK